ncbi:MAG TPA: hypothetical protein VGK67_28155 [Myxococcales bacterium]|jgi:antitoxin component YwqK of YwqJK toxin-antitoxin module
MTRRRIILFGVGLTCIAAIGFGVFCLLRVRPVDSDEYCPITAHLRGHPPPVGFEQYCEVSAGSQVLRHGIAIQWAADSTALHRVVTEVGHYRNGKKEGEFRRWHQGALVASENFVGDLQEGRALYVVSLGGDREEGEMLHGRRHGVWKTFSQEGSQVLQHTYAGGVEEGAYTSFAADGSPASRGFMKGGRRDGHWVVFGGHELCDGKCSYEEGDFSGSERTGTWRGYSPSKRLLYERTIGTASGPDVRYNHDGEKIFETNLVSGRREGTATAWFDHGAIKSRGIFADGNAVGEHVTYYPDGGTARVRKFESGHLVSETLFFPDGKVEQLSTHDALRINSLARYYPDGTIKMRSKYAATGGLEKSTTYWANGRVRDEMRDQGRSTTTYYPDGSKRSERTQTPSARNSRRREYDRTGRIISEGEEFYGLKEGTWTYYRGDGTISLIEDYDSDYQQGRHVEYFPSGKVHVQGAFRGGHKCCTWIEFDPNGKEVSSKELSPGQPIAPLPPPSAPGDPTPSCVRTIPERLSIATADERLAPVAERLLRSYKAYAPTHSGHNGVVAACTLEKLSAPPEGVRELAGRYSADIGRTPSAASRPKPEITVLRCGEYAPLALRGLDAFSADAFAQQALGAWCAGPHALTDSTLPRSCSTPLPESLTLGSRSGLEAELAELWPALVPSAWRSGPIRACRLSGSAEDAASKGIALLCGDDGVRVLALPPSLNQPEILDRLLAKAARTWCDAPATDEAFRQLLLP